eukprot:scaffold11112_cov69-Cyclotella_meneghiniana.AAC.3
MDHIAHVIVPDVSTISEEPTIICEEVIQWVLKAANQTVMANDGRQVRIDEWNEGNQVSNSSHILDPAYRHDPSTLPLPTRDKSNLNPVELLALGSIWYLSVTAAPPNIDRFDPSNGIKPRRLSVGDWNMTVQQGDYLRIHFDPRRFRETNKFNWGCRVGSTEDAKPGVIVARNDEMGYIVIDKPSNIPVHARVDNVLENVASSVGKMLWIEKKGAYASKTINALTHQNDIGRNKQKQKMEQLVYVATPQRLDQNTTGLMAVATKKSFAAYFAKLLRTKTSGQLTNWRNGETTTHSLCGVHKTYKCLVCIMQYGHSMMSEVEKLQNYARDGTIIRHYLEPSIKAPKLFHSEIPKSVEDQDLVGNRPSEELADALWDADGKPDKCIGAVELEVELITGRTHQIRGQLSALGYPLVGDTQYGGAVPSSTELKDILGCEKLALQCSALKFLSPVLHNDNSMRRSDHWNSFTLNKAFWSPYLKEYERDASNLSLEEVGAPELK